MSRTWSIPASALGLFLVVILVLTLLVASALPKTQGRLRVAGLDATVEVWRDSLGIPHIWASTRRDLFFAQGFVHAQDRLWQMELLRRVAEGRLAEVLGEGLVASDRHLRVMGLWESAALTERGLDPRAREWLEAYSEGVNAYVESRGLSLPPEFLLLRIRPEPWTPRHSLAIEKIMAMDLALYGTSRNIARAARAVGVERARLLVPDYPEWGAHILDAGGEVPALPELPESAAALLESASIARASNAWVIGGAHTRSGRPILANDMHLALRAPSLWYLMALHAPAETLPEGEAPALDVAGQTLPGSPFVMVGGNRALSWGFTNAMVDDLDFFIERLDPADSTRYLVPGGSEPFQERLDTIRVRGADPRILRVRRTRHGPVISDAEPALGDDVVSLRWVAHEPGSTFRALPAMNQARSGEELLEALRHFSNPHLNVVWADSSGDFGYVLAGRVPIRANGAPPPLLPVPGWSGEWDWVGYLPFESHPVARRPDAGYVVTANNRHTRGGLSERIGTFWLGPYRATRITRAIEEVVAAGGLFDAEEMHRIQHDLLDVRAQRLVGRAIEAANAAGLRGEAHLLSGWDGESRRDSRAAALFHAWAESVGSALATDFYDGERGWLPERLVDEVIEAASIMWGEGDGARRYQEMSEEGMRRAAGIAAGREWGQLNRVLAEHPLGGVRSLDRLLRLNVGPLAHHGSGATINVSHWRSFTGTFPKVTTYGPSQRQVLDMGDPNAGGFIIPTGQSGIPFSRHYRDQFGAWARGGLAPLPLEREAAELAAVRRLTLEPAR